MVNMNSELPLVSIIMSYYKKDYLDSIFEEIKKNTNYPNYEIIVVENNSPESQEKWIKEHYPEVRYYKLPVNLGFGRANNIGVKKAKGKYCVLLNTDTFPRPNWMNYCIQILEKHPEIGLLSPLSTYLIESEYMVTTTNQIRFRESYSSNGPCLFFPKSLIQKTNNELFDPYFFFYGEDTDLDLRTALRGLKLVLNTSSIVFHGFSDNPNSHKKKSNKRLLSRYETQNKLYLVTKHASLFNIYTTISLKTLACFLSPVINRSVSTSQGILEGFYHYLKDIGRIIQIRFAFQKEYPKSKEYYTRYMNSRNSFNYNNSLIHIFPKTSPYFWQKFIVKISGWRLLVMKFFSY